MKERSITITITRRRRSFNFLISLLLPPLLLNLCFSSKLPQGEADSSEGLRFIRGASTWSTTTKKNEYDYIVVGGGTAACPLAATLSRRYKVLVLERGGVPFNNLNISYMQNFHINLADLSPNSASQFFVSTDGVFNSRARVLGGATCINAGFYTRASARFGVGSWASNASQRDPRPHPT